MKNLSFWQKTYFLTLALFLVALFGGIGFIGWQNQQQTLASETENVKREQQFIAQAFSRDLATIETNAAIRTSSLAKSYSEYYAQQNILLEVQRDGETIFSTLPDFPEIPFSEITNAENQAWATLSSNQGKYIVVASPLTLSTADTLSEESAARYTLTVAQSIEPLLTAWEQTRHTLIVGGVLVSIVLAVGLFFVLRGLAKPLEKLAAVADEFTAGNFDVRAVKKSNDEIGTLATSFNAMADTAKQHIAEISTVAQQNERMAANLSHEIRTPLTAIKGYAEYLQLSDPTPEERESALAYIVNESDRLQAISERMLQLSTLEQDALVLEPVNIAALIEKVTLSVQSKATALGASVINEIDESASIKGDPVLLESLFINLIDNALTASSSIVRLRTTLAEDSLTVEVVDNGCGLSDEEAAKLGEPFYRPDKARSRNNGGAGLGVALCRQIAQLHNAHLTYFSAPQQGTVASVKFTTL